MLNPKLCGYKLNKQLNWNGNKYSLQLHMNWDDGIDW
jgi:hypothetical protein